MCVVPDTNAGVQCLTRSCRGHVQGGNRADRCHGAVDGAVQARGEETTAAGRIAQDCDVDNLRNTHTYNHKSYGLRVFSIIT